MCRPLLRTGYEVLVRECATAIWKWCYNFDLGLTSARMAYVTGGGKPLVGGLEFGRVLRVDGLVQNVKIRIEIFKHLIDGEASPMR